LNESESESLLLGSGSPNCRSLLPRELASALDFELAVPSVIVTTFGVVFSARCQRHGVSKQHWQHAGRDGNKTVRKPF
jgi:hypothetical protein